MGSEFQRKNEMMEGDELSTAPATSRKLKRTTVADATTERLRSMIISGELSDGAPLRQDSLAEELGVSRIPVREALSRLEAEGLAASEPHRGYVVTALSRDEIEELFDLRALLEPELVRLAIPRVTEAELEHAQSILARFNAELDGDDIHSWGELNTRFHLALYAPAGRRRTFEIVRGLLRNTDRYTRLVLTQGAGIDRGKEDHGGLLDLYRKRARNEAAVLARSHIQRARSDLLKLLEQRLDRE